ncbi:putative LRR receptor-like serine/threonine-protein kinase [Morus notabilis]|uniref:Putative LRR receptor-like serine/threonine-protein kinase n=1 Tax=Morus notabilis TaxID=981085 RepID=W9R282_9ROSA|nr:putative LRR receptor-like serine/threonine-protein kinase [Morus notabilis]
MKISGVGLAVFLSCLSMQLFLFTSAFSKLGGNDKDRLALLEFKAKVTDPLGVLNSWNDSQHFCEWQGVVCSSRHRRVTILDIQSSGLGGKLSPHIGNLSFLRILNLNNNSFSQEIPEEIGRLFRIRSLILDFNSFIGKIPLNISSCSKLKHLFIQENNLTGEIPEGVGSLSHLKSLAFPLNNLNGEIPSSIANLSNSLEFLNVDSNNLHGSIPSSFDQLKRLSYLSVGDNKLTGTIPPSIFNLSLIRFFSVETNRLEGNLPPKLGHLLLPNLETVYFHTNRFTGPVPSISNASKLINFQILSNQFTGKLPDFSGLPSLKILLLQENNLGYGEDDDLKFLSSLVNLTNLEQLAISQNNLGGVLPECIGNFSAKLWLLMLGSNAIKGSIPTGIGNLVNLQGLGIEDNQVIGHIPSSIGKLQTLYELDLQSNNIAGTIPSSFGNLTSLNVLGLRSNNLQGSLPLNLGECKNLRELDVSQNNLNGTIPKEVLGFPSITLLALHHNYFTGHIPETLGTCISLESLYLHENLFQGNIPQSLKSLIAIEEIYLSHNNLSGKIPTFLEGFRYLQILNLSFNNFDGEIPTQGIFKNASAISIIGNTKLCGGIPQLSFPKCPAIKKNKKTRKPKIIIVSAVCGVVALMLVSLFTMLTCSTTKRNAKSIFATRFGISFLEVSYRDLLKATDEFSSANLIGTGSFGSVYKGTLNQENRLIVAVKVLNLQTAGAIKSFIAECKVLKSIKHRNLVKLLTACSSTDFQGNDFKALVYELMINGSLEEWLHPRQGLNSEEERHLSLIQRINIAIDVANALDYLHNHCHVPIVHSDLKPSNILLDDDMTAHVGDFGLARFLGNPSLPFSSFQSSSIGIRGSIGYTAPEYAMGADLSKEGDVYSFGILLLETFTRKRPTHEMFKDDSTLHNFVKTSLPERLVQVVDRALLIGIDQAEHRTSTREVSALRLMSMPNSQMIMPNSQMIMNTNTGKCLHSILKIGISCSEETPKERMNMGDVVKDLIHVKSAYLGAEIRNNRRPGTS